MLQRYYRDLVRQEILSAAAPHLDRTASEGEIWWAAPRGLPIEQILEFAEIGAEDATIVGDDLGSAPLLEGKAWLKIRFSIEQERATFLKKTLRPGLLLKISLPSGHALIIPGTTKDRHRQTKGLPSLKLRERSGRKRAIDYEIWNLSVVKDTPPEDLVEPLATLADYSLRDSSLAPLTHGHSLLRQTLGLEAWSRSVSRDPVRLRSEVVRIVGQRSHGDQFGVVLSANELNQTNRSCCVLAPLVQYQPSDSADSGFLPLSVPELTMRCGQSSVDLLNIQGFTNSQSTTLRLSPRLVLSRSDSKVWREVEKTLGRFYG